MNLEFLFQWLKRFGVYLLLLVLFIMHLQFLTCDPALNFCGSRGPFTDEGIYLFQVRNYLNGHGFNLHAADAVLKSPLFSLLFFLPLKIFGIHLSTARAFALLLCFVPLVFVASQHKFKGIVSVMFVLGMLQTFLFQYTHYSMAEMIACCWILCAFIFLFRYYETGLLAEGIISCLLFLAVVMLKIQFVYIVPLAILLLMAICLLRYKTFREKKSVLHLLYFILILSFTLAAFYLFWYRPQGTFFRYIVMTPYNFPTSRYQAWMNMKFNHEHVLLNHDLRLLTQSFYLFLSIGFAMIFAFRTSNTFKFLFAACILWIGIEAHKMAFFYIPIRYLIPLLFAALLLISLIVSESIQIAFSDRNKLKYILPFVTIVASLNLTYQNLTHLKSLFAERSYVIKDLNQYIKHTIPNDGIIAGNWASSLCWEVPNETMLVVSGFLNDGKVFASIKPAAVIAEEGEVDSEGAFKNKGIDLAAKSDSIRHTKVGRWQVNVFRIK